MAERSIARVPFDALPPAIRSIQSFDFSDVPGADDDYSPIPHLSERFSAPRSLSDTGLPRVEAIIDAAIPAVVACIFARDGIVSVGIEVDERDSASEVLDAVGLALVKIGNKFRYLSGTEAYRLKAEQAKKRAAEETTSSAVTNGLLCGNCGKVQGIAASPCSCRFVA